MRGQSTVEYMLLLSFLTVALLVAGYAFLPGFADGVDELSSDVAGLFSEGEAASSGNMR